MHSDSDPIAIIEKVSHRFNKSKKNVLNDVSFAVHPGEVFTLLGENGAGKTTLVRILATLILPSTGLIKVCGHDHLKSASVIRKHIGFCSDSQRSFYYRLTAYQNLEFFAGLAGITPRELKERINHVLEMVGLIESRDLLFMRFSHGMRKKLSLARCLLGDPQLYLLDEPTSGVDPFSAITIRRIIKDLRNEGKAILLTTHNLQEASALSDQIGILRKGEIVIQDTLNHIREILYKRRLSVSLVEENRILGNGHLTKLKKMLEENPVVGCANFIDRTTIEIDLKDTSDISLIINDLLKSGIPIRSLQEKEVSLEDIFFHIVQA